MSRNDDTGEYEAAGSLNGSVAPGEPVGRVNLPNLRDDPPEDGHWRDQLREKVLFGVLAIALMVLAMVVILQGVFEQKMLI